MKLMTIVTMLVLTGCGKMSYSVRTVDCDDASIAAIYDAMQAWNDACGIEVFEPSASGAIRVFCSDKEYMYVTRDGKTVTGFYVSAGGYIALSKMRKPEQYQLLVQHELGHAMGLYENKPGGHSDDKTSVMYWTTTYTGGITEADIAEARRVGWSCR